MTLGSIFSKLSGIRLRSIAKWYGIVVMAIVGIVLFIFLAWAVGSIAIAIVTKLGFWGTLIVLAVATAGVCVNVFKDEIFPDSEENSWDRYQRDILLKGTTYKASPYNFAKLASDNTWLKVEEMIGGMKDGETCEIHAPNGDVHHCGNKAEALKVFNELWGQRKTE